MQQRARLVGDRVGDRRVRVPERGDREPAEEVEVLLALAVPQLHALAAHERDRQTAVGLHDVLGVERVDARRTCVVGVSLDVVMASPSCRCPHG